MGGCCSSTPIDEARKVNVTPAPLTSDIPPRTLSPEPVIRSESENVEGVDAMKHSDDEVQKESNQESDSVDVEKLNENEDAPLQNEDHVNEEKCDDENAKIKAKDTEEQGNNVEVADNKTEIQNCVEKQHSSAQKKNVCPEEENVSSQEEHVPSDKENIPPEEEYVPSQEPESSDEHLSSPEEHLSLQARLTLSEEDILGAKQEVEAQLNAIEADPPQGTELYFERKSIRMSEDFLFEKGENTEQELEQNIDSRNETFSGAAPVVEST